MNNGDENDGKEHRSLARNEIIPTFLSLNDIAEFHLIKLYS